MARNIKIAEAPEEHWEASESLKRVRDFDADSLVRLEELGQKFSFKDAVEPANRLKSVFMKLPIEVLEQFPKNELDQIKAQADNVFNLFEQILDFDPAVADASATRDTLIRQVKDQYQPVFSKLFPFISFAVARTVDFGELAANGRAAVQNVRDEASKVMDELKETSTTATAVLDEVRSAAAEQGVTQQARYFAEQADSHDGAATKWLRASSIAGFVAASYAIFTLFFPQFAYFKANTPAEAIQLTASKILIFVVLGYSLLQCVKNYSAHRHNSVTNRHRQNALLTYTTLAEAGRTSEARDTVLQHAAAAIYAPNDSGYVKQEERGYGGNPVVGFSPRSIVGGLSSGETGS